MSELTPAVRRISVDLMVTDQLIRDSAADPLHGALLEGSFATGQVGY